MHCPDSHWLQSPVHNFPCRVQSVHHLESEDSQVGLHDLEKREDLGSGGEVIEV